MKREKKSTLSLQNIFRKDVDFRVSTLIRSNEHNNWDLADAKLLAAFRKLLNTPWGGRAETAMISGEKAVWAGEINSVAGHFVIFLWPILPFFFFVFCFFPPLLISDHYLAVHCVGKLNSAKFSKKLDQKPNIYQSFCEEGEWSADDV